MGFASFGIPQDSIHPKKTIHRVEHGLVTWFLYNSISIYQSVIKATRVRITQHGVSCYYGVYNRGSPDDCTNIVSAQVDKNAR